MSVITPYLRALSAYHDDDELDDAELEAFLRWVNANLEASTTLHEAQEWRLLLSLWEPVRASPFLDPKHPEWADKFYHRCRIRLIIMHQFEAFVHSHFGASDGFSEEEFRFAFLYLMRLLSDQPFMPDQFDHTLDSETAEISDYNLRVVFKTALTWFEMYGIGTIAIFLDAEEELVTAVYRRLMDRR